MLRFVKASLKIETLSMFEMYYCVFQIHESIV